MSTSASQGATSLDLNSSSVPLVQYGNVVVGADNYEIASVSGSQSNDTLGLEAGGLDFAVAANTPVYYNAPSGDVAVEYLNINDDLHQFTGTIDMGSGWTVEHNYIHDASVAPSSGSGGVALYDGDEGTVEYNCLARMGQYGGGGAGTNEVYDYNELLQDANEPDPGCGCSGGGKWWGTLNTNIVDNSFVEDGTGGDQPSIWFDNGNSGALVEGNYFYRDAGQSISNETGYNMLIENNLFVDDGWGTGSGQGANNDGTVVMNSSGGLYVPGSRYENSVSITNNQFVNDWGGVDIWQSGLRSCLSSGEGYPNDAAYCSGGFPNTNTTAAGNQYYFSHQGDNSVGVNGTTTLAASASSGSGTVIVKSNEALNDRIDFVNPASTTTTDTTNISTFTGSGTINVTSTTGFPTEGQLSVSTSNGYPAILAYTGTTATTFTGVAFIHDPDAAGSGTLSGSIKVNNPAFTTTTSTVDVTTFTGSQSLASASTAGFPSSGELRVGTSAAFSDAGGGYTGAILSYTGISGSNFTGVTLVRGTGTLSGVSSGPAPIQEVQPYKVTAEACNANDCDLTISPALGTSVVAGEEVTNAGTCDLYATSAATPTSPMDPAPSPNTESYWNGCQWQAKNISVTNNNFIFQPSLISAGTPPMGTATSTQCNAANSCGTNFMAYQAAGTAPFSDQTEGNAMMSNSSLTGCPSWDSGCSSDPLNNINALSSPPDAQPNNGEAPYNNVWSGNSYEGPWTFNAFNFGPCNALPTDSTTSKSMPSSDCGTISMSTWQSAWQQDTSSTYNPMVVSLGGLTSGQEIYGSAQAVDAYEDTQTGHTISSSLSVNGTTVGSPLTTSPFDFSFNTLPYLDGSYTLAVTATDSANNTSSDSIPIYVSNGDLTGAGAVNLSDLAIMAAHYGQTDSNYADGNITGQSTINLSDLAVLAANWGWSK